MICLEQMNMELEKNKNKKKKQHLQDKKEQNKFQKGNNFLKENALSFE